MGYLTQMGRVPLGGSHQNTTKSPTVVAHNTSSGSVKNYKNLTSEMMNHSNNESLRANEDTLQLNFSMNNRSSQLKDSTNILLGARLTPIHRGGFGQVQETQKSLFVNP